MTTATQTTTATQGDHFTTIRRANELLDSALDVLQETPASAAVRELLACVEQAVSKLDAAGRSEPAGLGARVLSASEALREALEIARREASLTDRQAQSMEAVARSMALLHPIAREHGAEGPPPIPWRRKNIAPTAQERRQHTRVTLETEVSFESENNFYAGFTEDISEGGLFLATYQLQPIGTTIEITFTLPDGHIVHAVGTVRWMRDPRDQDTDTTPGMGIQFQQLAPEDRDAIQRFAGARAPMFYED